jgi:hypothetical protein
MGRQVSHKPHRPSGQKKNFPNIFGCCKMIKKLKKCGRNKKFEVRSKKMMFLPEASKEAKLVPRGK